MFVDDSHWKVKSCILQEDELESKPFKSNLINLAADMLLSLSSTGPGISLFINPVLSSAL